MKRKAADCGRSKELQTRRVFGYVAKSEDIIIREREKAGLLRLLSGLLVALGTSILLWLVLTSLSGHILPLLILPWLQLLATAEAWRRVR